MGGSEISFHGDVRGIGNRAFEGDSVSIPHGPNAWSESWPTPSNRCFSTSSNRTNIDLAAQFFQEWHQEVKAAGLDPVSKVARMLELNIQGLLAYVKHKLTNGYAEAINGLIQEIKTVARGFRRFENFKVAILFFLGKLDLNPRKCS